MIPAFVNPRSGSATEALDLLAADDRFSLRCVDADELPPAIEEEIGRGATRILVAGGDGTLGVAATALRSSPVELAILPAGTLNHFARSLGLCLPLDQVLDIAAGTSTRAVDVGVVNDQVFLNTSSVGAYVSMVRRREALRPRVGYYLGGTLAAVGLFARLRAFSLTLEVDGSTRRYRTPLIYFGVGERDLRLKSFGDRIPDGPSKLHTVVVTGSRRARILAVALGTARHGIWRVARTPHVDAFLIDECEVDLSRPRARVALDGEIHSIAPPLHYRIECGALTVVAPAQEKSSADSRQNPETVAG